MKSLLNFVLVVFAILAVIAVGNSLFNGNEIDTLEPSGNKTWISKHEARVYAEMVVESRLKAPSTAEFSHLRDTKIEPIENGFKITGHVDSQNSFGAMLRSEYSVEIYVVEETGEKKYRKLIID